MNHLKTCTKAHLFLGTNADTYALGAILPRLADFSYLYICVLLHDCLDIMKKNKTDI